MKKVILFICIAILSLTTISYTKQRMQLLPFEDANGKYGYIYHTGGVCVEPQFDQAKPFSDGLALVRIDKKFGYINELGKMVIEPKFDNAQSFSDGLAKVVMYDNNNVMYINTTGKTIIEFETNKWGWFGSFNEGLVIIYVDDKFGYMDKRGKTVIIPQFDRADMFSEGLAAVMIDDKWGYINKRGKTFIKLQFDKAAIFSEGLAAVKVDDKWGYINKKGIMVIDPLFDVANNFSEGLALVTINENNLYINKIGEKILEIDYDIADDFSEGLALVGIVDNEEVKTGYINKTGKVVIDITIKSDVFPYNSQFSNGSAWVKTQTEQGYINHKGNFVWKTILNESFKEVKANLVAIHTAQIARIGTIIMTGGEFTSFANFSELEDWRPDGDTYCYYLRDEVVGYNCKVQLPDGLESIANENDFLAIAIANLDDDETLDIWTINDDKIIIHYSDDLAE